MDNKNIDALKEACKVAGDLFSEEKTIESIEKEIAEKIRMISKKIFENNNFRMKTQRVGMDEGETDGHIVYTDIFITHKDDVLWRNGVFWGNLKALRISTEGDILYVRHDVEKCSNYDLEAEKEIYGAWEYATDTIIAAHAKALAENTLKALKNRIDQNKEEKEVLQRMACAI